MGAAGAGGHRPQAGVPAGREELGEPGVVLAHTRKPASDWKRLPRPGKILRAPVTCLGVLTVPRIDLAGAVVTADAPEQQQLLGASDTGRL
jgi:hypothetical protein